MMRLDFEKQNGLIPCIVQDVDTKGSVTTNG